MIKTFFKTIILVVLPLLGGCLTIDCGMMHHEPPKTVFQDKSWEIRFGLSISAGYRPIEKYGALCERYRNIRVYVYDEKNMTFVSVETELPAYEYEPNGRKYMIIRAIIPEGLKKTIHKKLCYYIEFDLDGHYNRSEIYEIPVTVKR